MSAKRCSLFYGVTFALSLASEAEKKNKTRRSLTETQIFKDG